MPVQPVRAIIGGVVKESRIDWSGDLSDDCTARWAGLMLRAEEMEHGRWWWAIHDQTLGDSGDSVVSSNDDGQPMCRSGEEARSAAEAAAHIYRRENPE